ncbi:hypothetical protein BpHYR1_040305 [Brachionus plicatilis]|uniref:Uncharacterized protein n=1 Tax=Brachionus plicatilis TaxID=10195 RepID=A0A3M7PJ73_BRAPC|nr:hypothetical protein BpHYR1_040305 [Brachionus plicatilis]
MSTKIALNEKFSFFAEFDEEFKIYCDNKFEIFSKAASRFVKDEPSQYEYVEYKCLHWRKPEDILNGIYPSKESWLCKTFI